MPPLAGDCPREAAAQARRPRTVTLETNCLRSAAI
jgi:hypothetical protein